MSRIGKKPVAIPGGVTATIENGTLSVKGPKGTLTMGLSDLISYTLDEGAILVKPANDSKQARASGGCSALWCRTWWKASAPASPRSS